MTLDELRNLPDGTVFNFYYEPENRMIEVVHNKNSRIISSMVSGGDHVDYLTYFIAVDKNEPKEVYYDFISKASLIQEEVSA